jgi:uncharacterized membrane protein
MMGWYDNGWGAGRTVTMGLMMLFWIALFGIVIWAAVHFLRGTGNTPAGVSAEPTPRLVLDHRLAAGEIDAEQYAQLRRLLDGAAGGTVPSDSPAQP